MGIKMKACAGKKKRKNNNAYFLIYIFVLICVCAVPFPKITAYAEEKGTDGLYGRHLIQTTNVVEEYKGLQELGFLDTGMGEQGVLPQTENLPEYSSILRSLCIESAYDKARAAVVQINIGEYYGSGVIWDLQGKKIVIASNTHLLQAGDGGMVTFAGGVSAQGTVTGSSDVRDIGFIEVETAELEREDWLRIRYVNHEADAYENLSAGDALFVIGSASGVGTDYFEGTVGNPAYFFPEFNSYMLYGYCHAVQGMSGGGTFDADGNFLGMVTAGTERDEIASLPVTVIQEEYQMLFN